eukprot:Pgem_evm1s8732
MNAITILSELSFSKAGSRGTPARAKEEDQILSHWCSECIVNNKGGNEFDHNNHLIIQNVNTTNLNDVEADIEFI